MRPFTPDLTPVQIVLNNFSAERIAMNAEDLGRFGLIALRFAEGGLNELLFEFSDSFFQEDSLFDHFRYQLIQLLSHCNLPLMLCPPMFDCSIAVMKSLLDFGRSQKRDHS